MSEPAPALRIDKWLWHARFFKTRSLAAKVVASGAVRVNSERVVKSSSLIRIGDVLTFAKEREILVVEVAALGERRGPAPEARLLYQSHTKTIPNPAARSPGYEGKGRPTKKDRRAIDQNRPGTS